MEQLKGLKEEVKTLQSTVTKDVTSIKASVQKMEGTVNELKNLLLNIQMLWLMIL